MLHGFNYTFPATTRIGEAARKSLLERSGKIEVDAEFLDLARPAEPDYELRLADFLRQKYARRPPDVIMTLGSAALPFLMKHRDVIAPNIPVVFTSVSVQGYADTQAPPGVTGIISTFDLGKTLELAGSLQPDARQLFVIAGSGVTDRRWQSVARDVVGSSQRKFETTYLFDLTYEALVSQLAQVPRDAIVILLTVFADAAGNSFIPADVAPRLSAISPAPVYAPYDTYINRGIVGGFVETFESVGVAAADMILEVLAGKDPATLPPRVNPEQAYRVDFRAMQRWGLHEGNLPQGAIVLNKQPTMWDQYRAQALTAFAIVILQAALIAWLLFERYLRRRATVQAGAARAESGQYRESLAHLVRVHMVGEMSTAITHEVNQPLAAIKNYAFAARLRLSGPAADPTKVGELLDKIEEQASRAGDVLHSLRAMVKKHDSERDRTEIGQLVTDAVKLVEMESHTGDIRLESTIAPDLPPVFVDRIQVQQVVLNLTRNAVEAMEEATHAGAIKVGVRGNGHGEIAVSVADPGPGVAPENAERIFDPFYSTKGGGLGVGLSICRAIVEAHGGRLTHAPNAGGGSVFQFTLPAMKTGSEAT
jgi:signal transduction histidine kinase